MTKIFSEVRRLPEFDNDFNRLLKRFGTLEEDLKVFIEKQLKLLHKLGIDNGGCVRISGLGKDSPLIYKARKFACRSLFGKGSASGIRIIYAYWPQQDTVDFIEIYYKDDKENEDRQRILRKYACP
jgi:mRNA-degrading endonuclease RelE of RelBE toxin-antitoxin system